MASLALPKNIKPIHVIGLAGGALLAGISLLKGRPAATEEPAAAENKAAGPLPYNLGAESVDVGQFVEPLRSSIGGLIDETQAIRDQQAAQIADQTASNSELYRQIAAVESKETETGNAYANLIAEQKRNRSVDDKRAKNVRERLKKLEGGAKPKAAPKPPTENLARNPALRAALRAAISAAAPGKKDDAALPILRQMHLSGPQRNKVINAIRTAKLGHKADAAIAALP